MFFKFCVDAEGEFLPLYVLYKGKNLWNTWLNGPDNCRYQVSTNGWMEQPSFQDWFQNVFLTHVKSIPGTKLLIYDGHSSHIHIDLVKLAKDNDVVIVCLPPHSTHVLQPLDTCVFKSVKTAWEKILRTHNHGSHNIDKALFPSLLKKLVDQEKNNSFGKINVVKGFLTCGLYPLDKLAISVEKLAKCMDQIRGDHIDDVEENDEDDEMNEQESDEEAALSSDFPPGQFNYRYLF